MSLFVQHFVQQSSFTYRVLRERISHFVFKGTDALDKPCAPKEKSVNAVQNWVFLRLFPLLIGDLVDSDDEVWQTYLCLKEIVQMVCSPKLSHSDIGYLRVLIEDYIEYRQRLFADVKVRPKHHYLLHYPELMVEFGPLVRLWTLRFESKHSYLKRCCRRFQNFKNLTSSLSEQWQLLQAYYASDSSLISSSVIVNNSVPFHPDTLSPEVASAIGAQRDSINSDNACVSFHVNVKGTDYKKDMIVIIGDDNRREAGKIILILVQESQVYLVVSVHSLEFVSAMGIHVLKKQNRTICVPVVDLYDYAPLSQYGEHISLTHGSSH